MAKTRNGWMASRKEHFTYSMFFFGQNLLWGFAGMILTFLTDIGISAALAGTILIVPKIWDAVNDTIFGVIVDKTRFKNGQKFLPWVKIGVAAIGVTTLVMFAIPASAPQTLKVIWFIIAYVLFDAAYTMLDAPAFALPTVMTNSISERTSLVSGNKLWAMVGGVLATILIPMLQKKLGWFGAGCIFIIGGVILMLPLLFCAKERQSEEQKKEEDVSLKQIFGYVGKNKYLLITLIAMLLFGLTAVESSLSIYIARICLGDQSLGTILAACVAVPVILVSAVIPPLAKKFDKFWILVVGVISSIVLNVVAFFVGFENVTISILFTALKCMGLAFWQVIIYMLVADTVEYGTYKSGTRAAGITFSLQTFVSKLKNALITSLIAFSLALVGFVEGENVVQPEGVAEGIWGIFTLLPAIGYVIALLVLLFGYKLRDPSVQVMADYNSGKISYEEAVDAIGDKFGAPAVRGE